MICSTKKSAYIFWKEGGGRLVSLLAGFTTTYKVVVMHRLDISTSIQDPNPTTGQWTATLFPRNVLFCNHL